MAQFKELLEMAYLLSGPALVIIAYLALGQIRVAREQLETQKRALITSSKRDALKVTSDQVMSYSSKVIPLLNKLDRKIDSEQVRYFSQFRVEVEPDSVKLTQIGDLEEADKESLSKVAPEFAAAANALEAFATYFVSGAGAERLAYLSLGSTFCQSTRKLAPLLLPAASDGRRFSATLTLLSLWDCRLEEERLSKEKKAIEERLKNRKPVVIKTVGAD